MAHDDFYNFDPYWDDTKPDEEDLCNGCGQTAFTCRCDPDLHDYEIEEPTEDDYL